MDRKWYEQSLTVMRGLTGERLDKLNDIKRINRELHMSQEELFNILAYMEMIKSEIAVINITAGRKIKDAGMSNEDIEKIFKFEKYEDAYKETNQQIACGEQADKVKSGYTKPAYKSDITPELCKSLYAKLGTQQAVADELGVTIKTIRSRLNK